MAGRRRVASAFLGAFAGVQIVPPVAVTSGFDKSVHLVGSSISTLKPFLAEGIPDSGVATAQPAVRTQNLKILGDCKTPFAWGGYFTNFSILHPAVDDKALAANTLSFFLDDCAFETVDVLVRATHRHESLMPALRVFSSDITVEWDSRPDRYYTHSIGTAGISGTNFNIALRHPLTGEFDDVGNFIHFVSDGLADGPRSFAEVGFGDTTILRAQLALDHVLDSFDFPYIKADYWAMRHMQDAFLIALTLWNEGLRPSNRDARTKLLRKYLESCRSIVATAKLSQQEVHDWLLLLCEREFQSSVGFGSLWEDYMKEKLWN
ncbi:hypothetical protein [Arthrobacter sp. AG258]|uniref:hypothetical protein n=1 Tax=Arthrobacter sp. AG258 TaxID=2183899 RepID=UPI001414ECD3|nr:hypothetical protein [Arthrobacter sp. AG258]